MILFIIRVALRIVQQSVSSRDNTMTINNLILRTKLDPGVWQYDLGDPRTRGEMDPGGSGDPGHGPRGGGALIWTNFELPAIH